MKNPFLHPSGRAKFLENSLLPKSKFEQMVSAKDADAALEILKDTMYSSVLQSKTASDYQQIYGAAVNSAYAEIKSIHEPFLSFFKTESDFFNIKLIFKNKSGLVSFESAKALFSEYGSFGKTAFEAALKLDAKDLGMAFPEFGQLFSEMDASISGQADAYLLEAAFDRQTLEYLYRNAPDVMKPGIKIRIDLANLRILSRAPKHQNGAKLISSAAVSFGGVPREEIIALFGKSAEGVSAALKNRIPPAARFPDIEKIEAEMETSYLRYARSAGIEIFGPGPAISYFIARLNEARNIRTILIGKQSNMDSERIRSMLRFAD